MDPGNSGASGQEFIPHQAGLVPEWIEAGFLFGGDMCPSEQSCAGRTEKIAARMERPGIARARNPKSEIPNQPGEQT
jgi:hypothetical protein